MLDDIGRTRDGFGRRLLLVQPEFHLESGRLSHGIEQIEGGGFHLVAHVDVGLEAHKQSGKEAREEHQHDEFGGEKDPSLQGRAPRKGSGRIGSSELQTTLARPPWKRAMRMALQQ